MNIVYIIVFLGMFAKLKKLTISFVMSVSIHPSIHLLPAWNNLSPSGQISMKLWI